MTTVVTSYRIFANEHCVNLVVCRKASYIFCSSLEEFSRQATYAYDIYAVYLNGHSAVRLQAAG